MTVYPRVCGGTSKRDLKRMIRQGLSPRVRGNQIRDASLPCNVRSIPACAGEPIPCWPILRTSEVYPRVCGGTSQAMIRAIPITGLSPRVRGNHTQRLRFSGASRSIPACTGEPGMRSRWNIWRAVYPRVCGGTVMLLVASSPTLGLSPRVRGNLRSWHTRSHGKGSIPACAGELRQLGYEH